MRATGRYEDGLELGFPLFFTGIVVARFHVVGTFLSLHDWLKSASRQLSDSPLSCFMMSFGTSSGPAAFLRFSLLITFFSSEIDMSPQTSSLSQLNFEYQFQRTSSRCFIVLGLGIPQHTFVRTGLLSLCLFLPCGYPLVPTRLMLFPLVRLLWRLWSPPSYTWRFEPT